MSLIKNIYNTSFYEHLAQYLEPHMVSGNKKTFVTAMMPPAFEQMEWKERVVHTTQTLQQFLPADYPKAVGILVQVIDAIEKDHPGIEKLAYVIFPDYLARFGLDDLETSTRAMERMTQFITCEFGVRPFILKYPELMLEQMTKWSLHPSHKVRRLASEGSRPRLPWAVALPFLKKDPQQVIPLLSNLMEDESDWVRKSVANHLNDISKDHPEVFLSFVKNWQGKSKATDAIIKHGARTLLKQAHPDIVVLFELNQSAFELTQYRVITPQVLWGAYLEFALTVKNTSPSPVALRLEYAMYYRKANNTLSKKVFKISERTVLPYDSIAVTRRQSFKAITTRVYYPGLHQVAVIVNGVEHQKQDFELLAM